MAALWAAADGELGRQSCCWLQLPVGGEGSAVAAQWLWVSLGVAQSLEGGAVAPLGLPGGAGTADRPSAAVGEDSQSLPMMSVVLTS